jgi:hypothetical protein
MMRDIVRKYDDTRPVGLAHHIPATAETAIDPSTGQLAVSATVPGEWKSDPSRACDTRAGDRDGRGDLRGSGDGGGVRRPPIDGARRRDTSRSSTRDRDHTRHKSQRAGYRGGRPSGEGVRPRRSRGGLRLDTRAKP